MRGATDHDITGGAPQGGQGGGRHLGIGGGGGGHRPHNFVLYIMYKGA